MNDMETRAALKGFITGQLLIGETSPLGDEDELLLDGIIDSLGVTRVIGFIEHTFGVVVPREEATVENFRTVAVLAGYLERKTSEGSEGS